jgi:VanZ family protein
VPLERRQITPWIPVVLWLAFVAGLGGEAFEKESTAGVLEPLLAWLFPDAPPWQIRLYHKWIRKTAHAVEYGVAALLVYRACVLSTRARLGRWALALRTLALVGLCAVADEGRQSLLTSRTGTLSDVAIDLTGAALAVAVAPWIPGVRRRRADDG